MSVVYRARHSLLRRRTAIKLLRPEAVTDVALARFEREVQLASSLTHPNTIDIFDFGKSSEGTFYCVMEFLDGQSLDEVVHSEGPLPPVRAVKILLQIANSLSEAHRRGLVHRDIKPSNVMICEQGGIPDFVKVLDFGLARNVEPADGQNVTKSGLVLGTPLYMAPERITDPTCVDQRSDIYSLGAVGHYLLTGKSIYDAGGLEQLVRQILSAEPRRPSDVTDQEIPQELEGSIVGCLARDPRDRPATMQELTATLAEIDAGLASDNSDA